jgi:DNA adenine methylase
VNDIDPSIWSFWFSVLNHTKELVELIEKKPVTMAERDEQKKIQMEGDSSDPLKLGFSAFFLNRTNRSGIISGAGAIGGNDQIGNYKVDCRFNKGDLIRRIVRVAKYKSQIKLSKMDAVKFMKRRSTFPSDSFFCIDPPYYKKGSSLYTSFYSPEDHSLVAETVKALKYPWVVTYDNVDEIQMLYKKLRQFNFGINYSLQTKRVGKELLIASKGLRLTKTIKEKCVPASKVTSCYV